MLDDWISGPLSSGEAAFQMCLYNNCCTKKASAMGPAGSPHLPHLQAWGECFPFDSMEEKKDHATSDNSSGWHVFASGCRLIKAQMF